MLKFKPRESIRYVAIKIETTSQKIFYTANNMIVPVSKNE